MILNIIDKQRGGRSPNHLLYCRGRAVDGNRWRINNVSGRTRDRGSVMLKLKCYLKTQGVSQALDRRYWQRWTEILMHTHMDTQTHMHLTLPSQPATASLKTYTPNCVITRNLNGPLLLDFSVLCINLPHFSLCTNTWYSLKPFIYCRTSMKEIPTLQTSAWIPYCSPDILSGCGVKTNFSYRLWFLC